MICSLCGKDILTAKEEWWFSPKKQDYCHTSCTLADKKRLREYEKVSQKITKIPTGFCPDAQYKRTGCKTPAIDQNPEKVVRRLKSDSITEWQQKKLKMEKKRILATLSRGKGMSKSQIMLSLGYADTSMPKNMRYALEELVESNNVKRVVRSVKKGGDTFIAT